MNPYVAVPAEQAWFWTNEWQAKEREADENLAAGHVTTFDTSEDFLAHLDRIAGGAVDDAADDR
jgi:hypothetical protein